MSSDFLPVKKNVVIYYWHYIFSFGDLSVI